ncbi:hypothetical protein BDN72DRAFT_530483 [Pluteus cervinus]|uniref:Uncharacterized protein n=1 Tax=Pluteus cervinus TaxID=181527 RepID=A0ACD3A424_9AGAR|nr:hypothetical protein BDN72DRAFT_530483 [Pluteus cervinus]
MGRVSIAHTPSPRIRRPRSKPYIKKSDFFIGNSFDYPQQSGSEGVEWVEMDILAGISLPSRPRSRIALEVESSDTIDNVKAKIQDKASLPIHNVRALWHANLREDSHWQDHHSRRFIRTCILLFISLHFIRLTAKEYRLNATQSRSTPLTSHS